MHKVLEELINLKVCSKESLEFFHKGTRDNSDINILKCNTSGILILDKITTDGDFYENDTHYDKNRVNNQLLIDDQRRINDYKDLISNKTILDFGCGQGDFLKLSKDFAKESFGVELHKKNRDYLNNLGFQVEKDIKNYGEKKFDLIFLNHVFEHLTSPIHVINSIKDFMHKDSTLIIEVPHANDFLISKINNNDFKNFTFWSEHIVLHTQKSMKMILGSCGLIDKKFQFFQRYPIANHFYWMNNGKPNGHNIFEFLNDNLLIKAYNDYLKRNQCTDTIIGHFKLIN